MKRLYCAAGLIIALTAAAFAQGTDDHNDAAPVQSGYAIVTPVTPTTSLTVFESFGLRRGTETNQAGLPAPDLITNATIFVDVSARLAKNVGIAITNPHASTATVTVNLRRNDGTFLASKEISIPARRQIAQFVSEMLPTTTCTGFCPPQTPLVEYTGTLSVVSNLAVSILAIRFRDQNFSTIPLNNIVVSSLEVPVIATGVGGAGAFLLPQFAAGDGWATEIVITNTGSGDVTVRVDLFRQDGTLLTATLNGQTLNSFRNLVVPGNGVLVLAPRDANGDDRF
jgi:hypothetical protein